MKKRHLIDDRRIEVAGELIDGRKHASTWRTEEAKRLMHFDGEIPPMLYDATVLRKAKQEELNKRLNVKTNDQLVNLRIAKYTNLTGIIRSLRLNPFYCMYWTEEQQILYKLHNKQANSYFAIDATGSIAKRIKLPEGQIITYIFVSVHICL